MLRARCARLESSLTEKETQLADLLAEGNRMAQEQLKTNNLIKTLRSKVKSLEFEKEKSRYVFFRNEHYMIFSVYSYLSNNFWKYCFSVIISQRLKQKPRA